MELCFKVSKATKQGRKTIELRCIHPAGHKGKCRPVQFVKGGKLDDEDSS